MASQTDMIDRAIGCLVGGGVGDALGAPFEYLDARAIARLCGGTATEMVGGGYLNVRPGQVTDDTEMMIALARAVCEQTFYDPHAAMESYLQWWASNPIDAGHIVSSVMRQVEAGMAGEEAAARLHLSTGGRTAGNGSIVRCAPLALRYWAEPIAREVAARRDSQLTHHDPLAAEACVVYCHWIAALLTDPNAPAPQSYDTRVQAALNADRLEAEHLAGTKAGYVLTALAISAAALRSAETFEEAMTWAVNLGGDTDTNAAVCGSLLGARFGAEQIPGRWLSALEPREQLRRLAVELVDPEGPAAFAAHIAGEA